MIDAFEKDFTHATSLEIQGVGLRFASNRPELVRYAPAHLGQDGRTATSDADIEVNVLWLERGEPEEERGFAGLDRLDRIGKRALAGPGELVCLDLPTAKRLQLRFRLTRDRLSVDAIHRFDPGRKGSGEERRTEQRVREFFRSMLHTVYYPVAWYLEHFRGLYLLHAAAVELAGGAVAIAGVGGVGKSTTSVALAARTRGRFLSESLVFYDGDELRACYEPVRMGSDSLALLGACGGLLVDSEIAPRAKKKRIFHVQPARRSERAPLAAVFLPRFARRGAVRPLPTETCVERLLAINGQSRKITDYYAFASALGMQWPRSGRAAGRTAELAEILRDARAFELDIEPEAGLEPVVARILDAIG